MAWFGRPLVVATTVLTFALGAPAAVALPGALPVNGPGDDPDPGPVLPLVDPTPTPTPTPSPSPTPLPNADLDHRKLPDLGLARVGDLRLVRSPSDQLQLRFSSTLVNIGPGTMIVKATRKSTKGKWTVAQRVHTLDGRRPFRTLPIGTQFAGDGHLHWHIQDIVRYSVFALKDADTPGGPDNIRRARKVSFCIYDNERRKAREGTPSRVEYPREGCGTRDSKVLRMGLSVGWGDKYRWTLPGQYADLTGLKDGDYRLLGVANPKEVLFERRTTNNLVFADFRLRRENGKATIRILRQGVRPPGTTSSTTAVEAASYANGLPASAVKETTDDEMYGRPMPGDAAADDPMPDHAGHGDPPASSAPASRGVDYAAWPSTPALSTPSSRPQSRKGRSPA